MKRKRGLEGDLSFLAILLLLLICLVFTGNSSEELWGMNLIMFCAASVACLVTYFYTVTAGLITDLLTLFGYVSYILYGVMRNGAVLNEQLYFWLLWIPIMTVAVHFFTLSMKKLQEENVELSQRVEELTRYDVTTGLENLYSFEDECVIYMRIAERYKMPLHLVVCDLRYENEVRRLMGRQKFEQQVQFISRVMRKTLRVEDSLFLLGDSPYLWGVIMFADEKGAQIAVNRLKDKMAEEEKALANSVNVDLRFGAVMYDGAKREPLEFLEKAKKRLAYDVPSETAQ